MDKNVMLDNLCNTNVLCLFKEVAVLADGKGLGLVLWCKHFRHDVYDFTIEDGRINYVRKLEVSDKEFQALVNLCDLDLTGLKKFAQAWRKFSK